MHTPGKRQAGILIPAFSPRRKGDLGIGDTLALRGWIDWASDQGLSFIQLLPINENSPEESPYSAISSIALDPIYLSLDESEIPWLSNGETLSARNRLENAHNDSVNYPLVRQIKRTLLELAWSKFEDADPRFKSENDRFKRAEEDWLPDYCLFRFLMEHHGENLTWDQWPASCRTPEKAREYVAQLSSRDQDGVAYRLGYFAFVQWLCFRQWRALRAHADTRHVKLMGDVSIGIHWHSCDVFFNRDEFHLEWCGGSPPEGMSQSDPFFQQWGQNWGIPLYRWDHMKANGFIWWKTRITRLTEIFQMFRLDHILGFYRIYAFPWRPERNHEFLGLSNEEAAAKTAGRLPRWFLRPDDTEANKNANRADGDIRLRAIIDAAHGAEIIAEDLGWVPDYVRPHLTELGIAGYRIPHWDCNEFGHPTPGKHFPENSFAMFSTHDHDPVCGIWRGCLETIRRHHEQPTPDSGWQAQGARNTLRVLSEFAEIPITDPFPRFTEGVHLRLLKALFDSNSRYASLMVTSLFGIDTRFNSPGTSGPQNWSYRMPWTLEEIKLNPRLSEISRKLAAIISISRRSGF